MCLCVYRFDFVEVYGQPSSRKMPSREGLGSDSSPELADLYRRLDAAIEIEDYEEAASVKAQIDEALLASD